MTGRLLVTPATSADADAYAAVVAAVAHERRWILTEPTVSTIIPGMRKPGHVEANLAASDGRPLEPGLLDRLKAHRWDRTPSAWSQ